MTAPVGVALLGTGLMGRMHSYALQAAGLLDPRVRARLQVVCGQGRERREGLADAFGWRAQTADWQDAVSRPDVQLVIVATRNSDHAAAAGAAIGCGKAVLCEKPLGATLPEARALRDAARRAGSLACSCAFNHRFVGALALARRILERREIGDVLHARCRFLLRTALDPTGHTPWRSSPELAGSGVIGDLASHHIDLVRWLAGEPMTAFARTRALRSGETEDIALITLELASGATAVLEASRAAGGHLLTSDIEIDGTEGTLAFSLQTVDELRVRRGAEARTIAVTHPLWWPAGHPLGWDASFVHQARNMLHAVAIGCPPEAATFEDGYRCALICDTALTAAATGRVQPVLDRDDAGAPDARTGAAPRP
jgi:predicted dehydrogenase